MTRRTIRAELAEIRLPEFGRPTVQPEIPADTYRARLAALSARAREEGHDVVVVYGDREHVANLAYLTGYDPRFEEALLVLDLAGGGAPRLLVGNEGLGYVRVSPIAAEFEVTLYQPFSLLGQDRSKSAPLAEILAGSGVTRGVRVGVAGWKHFGPLETPTPEGWLEIPAYLVDTLRELSGARERVCNANALLMASADGLRAVNDVDQLAVFEYAASHASEAVRNVVAGVEPGMSEHEAFGLMGVNGLPLSCHPMLSSGERARLGLGSPSSRRIGRGDPLFVAYGVWGALSARAGFVVATAAELPGGARDYLERLVVPYFTAVVAWYERLGLGVTGGELFDVVHDRLGDPFFGLHLNPGHLIGLDEWVDSPVYRGSTERLRSGMALQADVIPATAGPYFTSNVEDGVALADEELRAAFAERYPEAWARVEARRGFMTDTLGIRLAPEILPLSNMPAYLAPFLLSPSRAMRVARA